MNVSDIIVNL